MSISNVFVDQYGVRPVWLVATIVMILTGLLALGTAADEEDWRGPVNGCVSYQHHNDHVFGIGDSRTPLRTFCEVSS